MTDKDYMDWADTVMDLVYSINWNSVDKLIENYNEDTGITEDISDIYYSITDKFAELRFPSEAVEEVYLPVMENGDEDQWINMFHDADTTDHWDQMVKLIKIICKEGY